MAAAPPEPLRDAEGHATVDPDSLRRVAALMASSIDDERLALLGRAIQCNIDQVQVVRDLVLDDTVEPPTLFLPLR